MERFNPAIKQRRAAGTTAIVSMLVIVGVRRLGMFGSRAVHVS